ncbi:MAG: FAD-dependent oxidoreductase [Acidobacteria bacterium]|nr:MAG: FAD-dependent oxidoreductase [Acidobacteriota bacterium]REJ98328.1 MAG: FAD-dependent oxidoreductase [Acidobacteriota bacterium]REK17072.1 MAG: FAD-dependent oxidoreductase [Acidobacteriota bacterium]REK42982.1 MAG: FAD-dependent oxidoreductase [Acidobacteriota bacterium]
MLTRRDILKAFVGLPLAALACRGPARTDSIDGEIVGASNEIGHILRDRRKFEIPSKSWKEVDTVIVGGGISGLSAAWKLKKEGFEDFLVLELEERAGGTSASGKSDLVSYPWGAHYLPVPFAENEELVGLLDEMKLVESRDESGGPVVYEQFLTRDPEERIYHKGRWYEGLYLYAGATDEDLRQYEAFYNEVDRWIAWKDAEGKRAFAVPVANCSTDPEVTSLDKISFGEWLQRQGFTSERLIWYCDYACRDDYGLRIEQTSAWAGLFYFCSRVPTAGEESQSFITFPEGNGRFVDHFAKELGGNLQGSSLVAEIIPGESGVDVVYLDTRTMAPRGVRAKKVIFSAPLMTADYLIRGFTESPSFDPKEFRHNAWFVANLFLNERPKNRFPRDFPLSWDNVIYESNSLGYVTATHQQGIDYGPTVLTYYHPMAEEDTLTGMRKLLSLGWEELADICLTDLERAHDNIRTATTRIDIMRWGHAMISPRTGFVWGGERQKALEPFRNIHFAHSDLSGIAIFEEAFYHGLRAAEEVIEQG